MTAIAVKFMVVSVSVSPTFIFTINRAPNSLTSRPKLQGSGANWWPSGSYAQVPTSQLHRTWVGVLECRDSGRGFRGFTGLATLVFSFEGFRPSYLTALPRLQNQKESLFLWDAEA